MAPAQLLRWKVFMPIVKSFLSLLAVLLLAYASLLFFRYNQPIIKNPILLILPVAIALLTILGISLTGLLLQNPVVQLSLTMSLSAGVLLILNAALLVYVFLNSALLDYFQPFSLYDDVIYATLAGFLLLILRFAIDAFGYFKGGDIGINPVLMGFATLLFIASFWGWSLLQGDSPYQNIEGDPVHLFVGGEEGYASYRILGLIVIPAGAQLADGTSLEDDLVLAFAEARRNGSLDDGDIDLVLHHYEIDG